MRQLLQQFSRNKPARLIEINDDPYLYRVYLGKTKRLRFYLHKFVSGDGDRAVHDHPFNGLSIVLAGSYYEKVLVRMNWPKMHTNTRYVQFFNWIPADKAHQIISPEPDTWTLFITGRHFKGWGFFEEGEHGVNYENRFGNFGETPWWLTAPTLSQLECNKKATRVGSSVELYPFEY